MVATLKRLGGSFAPEYACFDYLFQLVVSKEIRDAGDVRDHLMKKDFYNIIKRYRTPVLREKTNTMGRDFAKRRLDLLIQIPTEPKDVNKTLNGLYNYHKEIMDYRGLYPWFMLGDKGKIRHTAKMYSFNDLQDRKPDDWVHDYYLSSLRSLRSGIEAVK